MEYNASDIEVLVGTEAVRRRPQMYIGGEDLHPSPRVRLLEYVVKEIAEERPQEVRILLWRKDAITIAYDGKPLPIEPFSPSIDGVSHPALYRLFLELLRPEESARAILNALSEKLVVSTMHADDRYRVMFMNGGIVSLLSRGHCRLPLGTTWFTYRPDTTLITGEVLEPEDVRSIAERVGRNIKGARIRVEDRITEGADWY